MAEPEAAPEVEAGADAEVEPEAESTPLEHKWILYGQRAEEKCVQDQCSHEEPRLTHLALVVLAGQIRGFAGSLGRVRYHRAVLDVLEDDARAGRGLHGEMGPAGAVPSGPHAMICWLFVQVFNPEMEQRRKEKRIESLCLFKEGIQPKFEDPANANGGESPRFAARRGIIRHWGGVVPTLAPYVVL